MIEKKKLEELERLTVEEFAQVEKLPIVVILDNIRSAMNVGSFFRTADAFKIQEIVLCGITATPPHKEILKTAIGATHSVSWKYFERIEEALQLFKNQGYQIIGIEQTTTSVDLQAFPIQTDQSYALVFGNEVEGLSEEILTVLDFAIEIPQYGTKHSLNVSVCGGVVMWEFAKRYIQPL